ncbi:MAG TPA: glycosyltransferase family 9 protein [Candidatus Tumulicola sp.]
MIVTGSIGEVCLCDFVAGRNGVSLAGKTSLPELARVIADASAIVVGNTGAAHVAAAVGTPTVSLFPPTIPAVRFRPWMVEHVLLGNQEIGCKHCRARVCPRGDHACIANVAVGDVLVALQKIRRDMRVAVALGAEP